MAEVGFGSIAVGSGFTEGWVKNMDLINIPARRVAANGQGPQIITFVAGAVAGRGASRTVTMYLGNAGANFNVGSAGSAVGTGYVAVPGWLIPNGDNAEFGYRDMSGSCYFGRASTSGTHRIQGAFGTFSSSMGGAYIYVESPSEPWGISATPYAPGAISIGFNAPASDGGTGVNGYRTQWANNPSFTGASTVDSLGGGVGITGLAAGTTYWFRVAAKNWTTDSAGTVGPWSSAVSATTYSVPSAPRNLAVTATGPSTATAAWLTPTSNGGSAITGYRIEWADNSGFTGASAADLGVVLSHGLTGLTPGKRYYVRVRASNGVGSSAWSSTATVDILSGGKIADGGSFVPAVGEIVESGNFVPLQVFISDSGSFVPAS